MITYFQQYMIEVQDIPGSESDEEEDGEEKEEEEDDESRE